MPSVKPVAAYVTATATIGEKIPIPSFCRWENWCTTLRATNITVGRSVLFQLSKVEMMPANKFNVQYRKAMKPTVSYTAELMNNFNKDELAQLNHA